ncbi:MAG: ABC transporter permease [Alphaproteobacteria bacterium]|jgi:ABC-2 type transport system permease protein|nr:ABC transporter permease [Rhodospirillaceae bacterium]MDG2481396.1 ABC transporter permease [Alphaproteobacteria bacterium]MBT6202235.1 ABC transporter permease [Rhodospirillaceae bacterium]MBT6512215.1 ABC transporter permease [Rhodospirillaceae bacterium]MBT7612939.1 ABC transporter permease [Rhodospirillaceae bacterium]
MAADVSFSTATRNWLGLWALYMREVRRFMKIPGQTVVAPAVTTMLFLVVFALALGRAVTEVGGVPFVEFLAPGLIMMAVLQNGFANASSSLIIAKVQGNIVDTLMPPLSPLELMAGLVLGAISRGVVVGLFILITMQVIVGVTPQHLWAVLFFALAGSAMMGLAGVLVGIWAQKFDQISALTNFFITPLTFLSGTFYSIDRLPENLQFFAVFNPFFYAIDGFRYGFTGHADSSLAVGAAVLVGTVLVLGSVCYVAFVKGWRLKS